VPYGQPVVDEHGRGFVSARKTAEQDRENPDQAVCETWLSRTRSSAPFFGLALVTSALPWEHVRQRATMLLSGWVAAKTKLQSNPRLQAALDTGAGHPFQNMLRELPAAVVIGCADNPRSATRCSGPPALYRDARGGSYQGRGACPACQERSSVPRRRLIRYQRRRAANRTRSMLHLTYVIAHLYSAPQRLVIALYVWRPVVQSHAEAQSVFRT
jgi:hypothetical protein